MSVIITTLNVIQAIKRDRRKKLFLPSGTPLKIEKLSLASKTLTRVLREIISHTHVYFL